MTSSTESHFTITIKVTQNELSTLTTEEMVDYMKAAQIQVQESFSGFDPETNTTYSGSLTYEIVPWEGEGEYLSGRQDDYPLET